MLGQRQRDRRLAGDVGHRGERREGARAREEAHRVVGAASRRRRARTGASASAGATITSYCVHPGHEAAREDLQLRRGEVGVERRHAAHELPQRPAQRLHLVLARARGRGRARPKAICSVTSGAKSAVKACQQAVVAPRRLAPPRRGGRATRAGGPASRAASHARRVERHVDRRVGDHRDAQAGRARAPRWRRRARPAAAPTTRRRARCRPGGRGRARCRRPCA